MNKWWFFIALCLSTYTEGWAASSAWGSFGAKPEVPRALPVARAVKVVLLDDVVTDRFLDAIYS